MYLVGAGPGDPGLLTARALELIAAADTILYDRLIPAAALDGARADAELLFVGKQGGGDSVPQAQTEELILARARAGATVVRLKGGDPFVFGRGGEEALRLRAASIPVSRSSPASPRASPPPPTRASRSPIAGSPVAVALVTGHEDPDKDIEASLDWPALAAFPGTLVFYMGVRALPGIARSLIEAGRSPEEPVAIVERGTLPGQRTVTGTLATIAENARARGRTRTVDHPRRPRHRARAGALLAATLTAGRADRRRHPRARLRQRPGAAVGVARRPRAPDARDPHRAATPDPRPISRRMTSSASRARSQWLHCSSACAPVARTRARWPARASRRSARAPRRR